MPIKKMNIPRKKAISKREKSIPKQKDGFILTVNDNGETREFCLNTEEYQEFLMRYEEKELI